MKTFRKKAGIAILAILAGGALAGGLYARDGNAYVDVRIVTPEVVGQKVDLLDPDSSACKTGCSLAKHDIPDFTASQFHRMLVDYNSAAATEPQKALETLLFYGKRTQRLLKQEGSEPLSPTHVAFLAKELARDHAIVELRLVGTDDKVLVATGPTRVPLGKKQHLRVMSEKYLPLEFNGTVMRVGLDYLWSRY